VSDNGACVNLVPAHLLTLSRVNDPRPSAESYPLHFPTWNGSICGDKWSRRLPQSQREQYVWNQRSRDSPAWVRGNPGSGVVCTLPSDVQVPWRLMYHASRGWLASLPRLRTLPSKSRLVLWILPLWTRGGHAWISSVKSGLLPRVTLNYAWDLILTLCLPDPNLNPGFRTEVKVPGPFQSLTFGIIKIYPKGA